MPHKAFQRLFIILFPLILISLALFLINTGSKMQNLKPKSLKLNPCNFNLALSFFPKSPPHSTSSPTQRSYLLSKKSFLNQISLAKPLKAFIFVLPVLLNQEENWIISKKVFFIATHGERKEISQLNQLEIQGFHKDFQILSLDQVLEILDPKSRFLLQILGSDREKILKNLSKITSKIQGELFLSSTNEQLIGDMIKLQEKNPQAFKIIHSFKTLIRSQILSFLPIKSFVADGVWVPGFVSDIEFDQFSRLEKENKKIFIEKEPPYSEEDLKKANSSYIFISSNPKLALSSVKNKKACFNKF